MKLLRIRTSFASIIALILTFGAVPIAAGASSGNAPVTSPANVDDINRTTIALEFPVRLADATTAAAKGPFDVFGYHYVNPGVEGEYFPSIEYTSEAFLSDFWMNYGMEPSVVGLVVRAEKGEDGKLVAITRAADNVAARHDPLDGITRFDSPASSTGKLWDESREAEIAAATERTPSAGEARSAVSWLPGWSQISMGTGSSNQALISTQHVWTTSNGEDLHAIPDYWAAEFKVALINEVVETLFPGELRLPTPPMASCVSTPNIKEKFWAKNYGWHSWSVFQIGAATAASIGAYPDINDVSDECFRQSMSIGIGFPRNVPYTTNGNVQLGTQIVAPKGNVSSNRIGAMVEAKEGGNCWYEFGFYAYQPGNYGPNTNCVGVGTWVPFPSENGPQSKLVIRDSVGAAYQWSPTTRVKVYTTANGLPEHCVSLWKDLFLDPTGNPVPQRVCSAG